MDIRNYDRVRVGVFEACLDVSKVSHSDYGNMAVAYLIEGLNGDCRVVEVRQKENRISLFSLRYSDLEIPEWWQDAEVLFRWEQNSNK